MDTDAKQEKIIAPTDTNFCVNCRHIKSELEWQKDVTHYCKSNILVEIDHVTGNPVFSAWIPEYPTCRAVRGVAKNCDHYQPKD